MFQGFVFSERSEVFSNAPSHSVPYRPHPLAVISLWGWPPQVYRLREGVFGSKSRPEFGTFSMAEGDIKV